MDLKWHIGCSGFYYNHWKGLFYPDDLPKSKWFSFYAEHFKTLELNVTFYRFPVDSTFEGWYKKTPEDFLFSVKAPRVITHYKKFNDTKELMQEYYSKLSKGLKNKLGPVLFQLPPSSKYSDELLESIIDTLDSNYRNVVEFRNESWWNEKVYKELGKHNISFCGMSHPKLPDDVIANTKTLYYRFHGAEALYKSKYSIQDLTAFVKQVKKLKNLEDVFIYFNNDIGGSAIENTQQLIDLSVA
jgi:uncharacterized protein YecE (DUF72 family)